MIMNKRDVLELRKRLKADQCNIDHLAGCYVDGTKNKVVRLNEFFPQLELVELQKYLEIAKKALGGTIGNNILELEFPSEEEQPGGKQQLLCGLRADGLKNEELLDAFYDQIIKGYRCDGNFLILIFHDTYDVITKTSDRMKLDESEEVYEYLLTTICPVMLSKPGLGYLSEENRIGARIRDWVVGAPELSFLFPAFDDRSADIHRVDYFVKDAKDSHPDFIEDVLGCGVKRTKTEKQQTFTAFVKHAFRQDEEKAEEVLFELEESLSLRAGEETKESETLSAPLEISEEVLSEILQENEIEEEPARQIIESVKQEFSGEEVALSDLIDEKALKHYAPVKRERELVKEVESLKQRLDQNETPERPLTESVDSSSERAFDVTLQVNDEIASEISARRIGDRNYILIPYDDGQSIRVNGESRTYEV